MSIHPNVTKEDKIYSARLTDQEKNHQAKQNKKGTLKQTHNEQLAETFTPIIRKSK